MNTDLFRPAHILYMTCVDNELEQVYSSSGNNSSQPLVNNEEKTINSLWKYHYVFCV